MDWGYVLLALVLVASLVAGMGRALAGPTAADRILAAHLIGTGGVAIMLVLSEAMGEAALADVALVLALLAAMATAVWLRRVGLREGGRG